ncbi:MAG TPA: serine/threonine-protein kinase [Ktedonobacteraceae bacterium]|nr:serine/threonine-protein kinase [Ktedonobacteraceae bacterium]
MADLVNTTLGSCTLLKLLSKGGMGEIYLARQPLLDRTVAVKVIRADSSQNTSAVKRFEHEARALAALEHPHIVPLYEYGYQNGIAYFVMPYISGGTLRERVQQGALSPAVAVQFLGQLATALDFAHQRSIVHRDIKPANVLLWSDDWLLLSDFGVAKLIVGITQSTGSHVGTPLYMAPEQWTGRRVSAQTDIYALGIMLYELLTGAPPFRGNDWGSIMHQHLQNSPPSIRAHYPDVPQALEQVVFRAIAREPAQRFQTATEFALAAQQALEEKNSLPAQPASALPVSPIFQGMPSNWRADPFAVPPALDPRNVRTVQTGQNDDTKVQSVLVTTAQAGEEATVAGISAYSTRKASQVDSPRQWVHIPLMTTAWKSLPGAIDTIAFLPETNKIISSILNTVFLWEVGNPHPVAQLAGHTRTIWSLVITSDGRLLASGSWDRSIRLWDVTQGQLKRTLIGHTDLVLALTLAMSDRMLVSASRDGTLRCWELPGGRQLRSIRHFGGPIWSLATLPSDDLIVAGAEDGRVGLWSLKDGQALWSLALGDVGRVHRLLILDMQQVLCMTEKGMLALVDLSTGTVQRHLVPPTASMDNAIVLDHEIIYADTSGMLYRWNIESGVHHLAIRAHTRRILAMAVQPASGVVATGGEDRTMKLWRFL